jgi:S-adenosylmethionine-diacylgycerolhomoserine-N-methlytransferase
MINPQWEELLQQAYNDLKPGGFIAVVDFHDSRFNWFKRHMGNNHVRMDGHLLPALSQLYKTVFVRIVKAYAGVWEYVLFVGRK